MRLGEVLWLKESSATKERNLLGFCCRLGILRCAALISVEDPWDVLAFGQGGCGVISGPSVHKFFAVVWTGMESVAEEFSTVLDMRFFQGTVAEWLHVESRDLTINRSVGKRTLDGIEVVLFTVRVGGVMECASWRAPVESKPIV